MPYEVEEPGATENLEDLLDARERNGWALVHIVQGFAQAGSMNTTIFYKPRYIFHRPAKQPLRLPGT